MNSVIFKSILSTSQLQLHYRFSCAINYLTMYQVNRPSNLPVLFTAEPNKFFSPMQNLFLYVVYLLSFFTFCVERLFIVKFMHFCFSLLVCWRLLETLLFVVVDGGRCQAWTLRSSRELDEMEWLSGLFHCIIEKTKLASYECEVVMTRSAAVCCYLICDYDLNIRMFEIVLLCLFRKPTSSTTTVLSSNISWQLN